MFLDLFFSVFPPEIDKISFSNSIIKSFFVFPGIAIFNSYEVSLSLIFTAGTKLFALKMSKLFIPKKSSKMDGNNDVFLSIKFIIKILN